MKRLAIVLAVIILLIITGGLMSQMASQGGTMSIPGVVRTSDNPDASALDMAPWKAEQLFLAVGFILFNMVGIGVTLMALMWFLNRQVKKSNAEGRKTRSQTTPVQVE